MKIFARIIQIFAILAFFISVLGFAFTAFDIVQLHHLFRLNETDFFFMCLVQMAISLLLGVASQLEINRDEAANSIFVPLLLAECVFFIAW